MKRIDRIYEYVKIRSQEWTEAAFEQENEGVTTQEVVMQLQIKRPNASSDLNELVRQGKLVKSSGRPVRYADHSLKGSQQPQTKMYAPNENQPKPTARPTSKTRLPAAEISRVPAKREGNNAGSREKNNEGFANVVGSNDSMRTQVDQAKAAILYPPKGLSCLITGPTGSGKTFFVHAMFRFAQANQVFAADKELVVFNCADYAHNPELLMAHLFGYRKGAFTGATETTDGLIQRADGGMLFMDEVHRLPPEGQEMIFYLMDHGTYNRLGETDKANKVNVRLVCATTEDPASSLLQTFVRRIPIVIKLPQFSERPIAEQVDLLKRMVAIEANRIQRSIHVKQDAVKALIGSVTYGNVGQLKSNVQLVCARAFLNYMNSSEISITLDELTPEIQNGLLNLANNHRERLNELTRILEPVLTVVPNESLESPLISDSYDLPYNLYEIIGNKAALLREDGLDQESINRFITTDINVHLKSFYRDTGLTFDTEKKLSEIIDQRIIRFAKNMFEYAQDHLDYHFQRNFVYAMSLHISSFLKRIQLGESSRTLHASIKNMVEDYPQEFAVAKWMKQELQKEYSIKIPEVETYYLTLLLVSLRQDKDTGRVGVVIAAHGRSTATSMAEVVTTLLGVDNIRAVDMPLEMKPQVALEKIIHCVKEIDRGSGVILLVDMGSLMTFSEKITEKTGIEVKTIDMVTTPIVLETVRKTDLVDATLDEIYRSLQSFRGYAGSNVTTREENGHSLKRKKAIIAICASGEGTAQKMKEIIDKHLEKYFDAEIEVLPISVIDMDEQLAILQQEYEILATTGIVRPKIDAVYIPMEQFFTGDAEKVLDYVVDEAESYDDSELTLEKAKQICVEYMTESFTFLNPQKLIEPLWKFSRSLLKNEENYSQAINLLMHIAGMFERALRQDTLIAPQEELETTEQTETFKQLEQSLNLLSHTFQIEMPKDEVYYLQQALAYQE
ncbi:sigma 54-interacting transcriptional regulator [Trichococcus ilyis]|uniref:Phosphotransferase system mannose-type iia component n=1 Tax=Trichococcus ilyis TaxID=640938 RepID=A0A143Y617_9LACT|nr:sigma-54-dependent transcriptional regulator [Trichococcus ilyis]CZQ81062.1 phosphotransferase system mannose-type iia component [Trichococcus ilyis]SEI54131.1 Transcriptional regulatory protein LevR, contains PRD, AAA+ and EIIA domains [Trichococcus ilyis]